MRLDAIRERDLPALMEARNEIARSGAFRQRGFLTEVTQRDWFERISRSTENIMFSLVDDDALVGVAGLCYVDYLRRHAEVSLYIDSAHRGNSHGFTGLMAVCSYGFLTLGMRRLWAEIYDHNEKSRGLFEKVGFTKEGTLRDHDFWGGRFHDSHLYGLLSDEWRTLSEKREATGKLATGTAQT